VTGRPITHCALVFPQQLGRDRSTAGIDGGLTGGTKTNRIKESGIKGE
jgi:hypothetical protein